MYGERLPGDPGWNGPRGDNDYETLFSQPASPSDPFIVRPRRKSKDSPSAYQTADGMSARDLRNASCFRKWQAGYFIIIPENNRLIDMWDIVVICAIMATAIILPIEVGVTEHPPLSFLVIGKIIDSIFSVDIVLTFNIAYTTEVKPGSDGVFERRPLHIAAHYMSVPFSQNMAAGWFWPDLFTVIQWDAVPGVKDMQSLRLVRVLRLVRMLRLVRVLKLFKRWQTNSGASNKSITIFKVAAITSLISHWLACVWGHLGKNPQALASSDVSFLTYYYNTPVDKLYTISIYDSYMQGLYMCSVIITGVGFGDTYPQNETEVQLVITSCFILAVTWSWVVANVVNVIINMDPFMNTFNQTMDDLNSMMHEKTFPLTLSLKVRRHLHEGNPISRRKHAQEAVSWLSEGLKGELAVNSGMDKVCENIWYFRGVHRNVLIEMADEFTGHLFSPNEVIMDKNSLSVIVKGTCLRNGKMLHRNAVFGEDMILVSEHLRDSSCPRSMSFLEVLTLTRDCLKMACEKFPDFDARVRKAQIRLALWRSFVRTAETRAAAKKASKGEKGGAWDKRFFAVDSRGKVITDKDKPASVQKGWVESMDKQGAGTSQQQVKIIACIYDLKKQVEMKNRESNQIWERAEKRFEHVDLQVNNMVSRLDKFSMDIADVSSMSAHMCAQFGN